MVGAHGTEQHGPRRWLRRALVITFALVVMVVAAGVAYVALRGDPVQLGSSGPDPKTPARAFTTAWLAGDYRAMYRQLSPAARAQTSYRRFVRTYRREAATGTLKTLTVQPGTRVSGHTVTVPVQMRTTLFGALTGRLVLPLVEVNGAYRISWAPEMVWPGLEPGEQLQQVARAPDRRGAILDRDRQVLARGPAGNREYPQGAPYYTITGFVRAPQTPAQRRA